MLIRRSSQLSPHHCVRSDLLEEVLQRTSNLHDDRPSDRPPSPPALTAYGSNSLGTLIPNLDSRPHAHHHAGSKFKTCLEGPPRRHPVRSAAVPQHLYEQLPGCRPANSY